VSKLAPDVIHFVSFKMFLTADVRVWWAIGRRDAFWFKSKQQKHHL